MKKWLITGLVVGSIASIVYIGKRYIDNRDEEILARMAAGESITERKSVRQKT
jgi:hypothetical protein